jgi:hypothetical protein
MPRAVGSPRPWLSRIRRQEIAFGYAGLAPCLVGFVAFVAGPLAYSFWLSFNSYNILRPPRFIGLANGALGLVGIQGVVISGIKG